ncbi:PaREP1 family protein [Vulcanisaeta distributa DSM 14429]|uniref:PaREP1 family protein n=1 Tax=Vulcanisaeta distributa (strain DSM 14429 / JCM 11212 / NBRC 100878 / IC-017) TaxID=572478 RepID=E1QUC1_VULDI|nr:PaREP1 family protein [Vulcanisaeta distributa DSM 14429]
MDTETIEKPSPKPTAEDHVSVSYEDYLRPLVKAVKAKLALIP